MNRFVLKFLLCASVLSACVREEIKDVQIMEDKVYASIESNSTKVQLDQYMKTVWTKEDTIWVVTPDKAAFYRFDGETGDYSGSFSWVGDETWGGQWDGKPSEYGFSGHHAIYMSSERWAGIGYLADGRPFMRALAPIVQQYHQDSYGPRSNVMYGTSTDGGRTYKFVNLLAYLRFSFTGSKKVRRITLTDNMYSDIAGSFYFLVEDPYNVMTDMNRSSSVYLDCGEQGVQLSDKPVHFYFALRPVKMTDGFTILVEFTDGTHFQQRTTKELDFKRNVIYPLATISTDDEKWTYAQIYYEVPEIKTPWVYGNTTTAGYLYMGDGNVYTFDLFSYDYTYTDGYDTHVLTVQAKNADVLHLPSLGGVYCIDLSEF